MNLRRRLSKLMAMPPREVVGRAAYRAAVAWERWQCRGRRERQLSPARLRRDLRHGADWKERLLASRLAGTSRLLPAFDALPAMRERLLECYPDEVARTIADADAVLRHEFDFFGARHAYPAAIDWHADPFTRKRWPEVYHADIPAGQGTLGFGDIKNVWELNRQQFLIPAAKAWLLTGRREYADKVVEVVADWITRNPYGIGVNWAGALEPAYRVLSWCAAYALVRDGLDRCPEQHLTWLRSFEEHGRFLRRHAEVYSSPYNHLIGEVTALYILAVMFPEFENAVEWRRFAVHVLEAGLPVQFYADGGSQEQATLYHHATLGFYLLAALVARHNGNDLAQSVWPVLLRAMEFSMWLTQPDGHLPAIGDSDDAKPVRMERTYHWDFRHFLAAGAVLFERPDFKHVAGEFREDALWLLGPEAWQAFRALTAAAPGARSRVFEASGYAVLRSDWTSSATVAVFDCGEQGGGLRHDAVPSASHGHADCLAVTLAIAGKPVLVDAGFYTYNGDEAWERFFRETAAHNTVRIDGLDQATHVWKMAWSHTPRVVREGHSLDGSEGEWVVARHEGFRHRTGVVHRRAIWLRRRCYLVILDELPGAAGHEVEANYQFAPDLEGALAANHLTIAPARMIWCSTFPLRARLVRGEARPDGGWVAPGLGVRLPAPRLTLSGTGGDDPVCMLSVVAPAGIVDLEVVAAVATTPSVIIRGPSFVDTVRTDCSLSGRRLLSADDGDEIHSIEIPA